MGFTVVDESQVEPFRGAFFKMRRELGATGLGINTVRLGPDAAGPPHDETQNGHEEVYVVLEGSGWLEIGGERVDLEPGRWVRVDASEHRQLHAGPEGIRMLAAGSTPGRAVHPEPGALAASLARSARTIARSRSQLRRGARDGAARARRRRAG